MFRPGLEPFPLRKSSNPFKVFPPRLPADSRQRENTPSVMVRVRVRVRVRERVSARG